MHGSRHSAGDVSCRRCPCRGHTFRGGCSRVEYQWIGAGLIAGPGEYVPFDLPLRGVGGSGKPGRHGCLVDRLAHCWVLRQQGCPSPVHGSPAFVGGVWGVVGGCGLFLFVPAHAGSIDGFFHLVPFCGVGREVRVWMGVTGLLFENYIVDASILKIIKCNFR